MLLAAVCAFVVSATPLERAQSAYDTAEYDKALTFLEQALSAPSSTGDRVKAYALLAFTRAAFDQQPAAVDGFKRALELDGDYDPGPNVSPKLRGLFEQARAAVPRHPKDAPVIDAPSKPAPTVPDAALKAAPEPAHPPLDRKTGFWVVVGVAAAAVIAGTVTGVVLAHQPPQGSLGAQQLR